MLGLAQRSQDELFHIALYNWLIQADLTDKLLEVVYLIVVHVCAYSISKAYCFHFFLICTEKLARLSLTISLTSQKQQSRPLRCAEVRK